MGFFTSKAKGRIWGRIEYHREIMAMARTTVDRLQVRQNQGDGSTYAGWTGETERQIPLEYHWALSDDLDNILMSVHDPAHVTPDDVDSMRRLAVSVANVNAVLDGLVTPNANRAFRADSFARIQNRLGKALEAYAEGEPYRFEMEEALPEARIARSWFRYKQELDDANESRVILPNPELELTPSLYLMDLLIPAAEKALAEGPPLGPRIDKSSERHRDYYGPGY
jgi:hypothetical protein